MRNLHPHDTRDARFRKKRRTTILPSTFGVVVRLLNSIRLAVRTLQLNFREKRPIDARDARFSLVSSFVQYLDLVGPTLHYFDDQRHCALESQQHGPDLVQCDFTATVFS